MFLKTVVEPGGFFKTGIEKLRKFSSAGIYPEDLNPCH